MERSAVPNACSNTSDNTAIKTGKPSGKQKTVKIYQERIATSRITLKDITKETLENLTDADLDIVDGLLNKGNERMNNLLPLQSARELKELTELTITQTFQVASALIEFLAKERTRNAAQRRMLIDICKETLGKFNGPEKQTVMDNLNVWKLKEHTGDCGAMTLPNALEKEIADGNIHLLASVLIDYAGYLAGLKYILPIYDGYRSHY